ncbi:MAG: bifunctional riboflavin kinase/FAD synthetase [Actinomycetes bacterium]
MTDAPLGHAPEDVPPAPSVVAIGVFDGVHAGHRAVLAHAAGVAADRGVRTVAVTFDRHPMAVVRPEAAPALLQPLRARVAALRAAGADEVVVLTFDESFSRLTPEAFVDRVLVGPLRAVHVVVGANFRFGHRAAGDVDALATLGEARGFTVDGLDLLADAADVVSSTRIRDAVARGDVVAASEALGRPFELEGEVVHGEGRGRTIGVPTANVAPAAGLLVPAGGVYAAWARVVVDADGAPLDEPPAPAVVNIGTRPTFDGVGVSVEAHLLDTDRDLYGSTLALAFVARLRDERRFDGVEDLVAQIHADVDAARGVLDPGSATQRHDG